MSTGQLSVVLAGGGTAGHVEPALALADALRAEDSSTRVTVVGTTTGLETRLVPARGHALRTVPRVPLPRRPSVDLVRLPGRLAGAVRAAGAILDEENACVAVGFGGYVSVPVYLAARRRGIPVVVHEANARAGIANRLGARLTRYVATSNPDAGLPHAQLTGIPLRPGIAHLDRPAHRAAARAALALPANGPVLLVSGGSQGAQHINAAVVGAAAALDAAGITVLHHAGSKNVDAVAAAVAGFPRHRVVGYIDAMDQAYAAADLMIGRAGAMTCAELAAVGLPAVYVPLPIGNGEQRLNALPTVRAGGGLLVADADLDPAWLETTVIPLLADGARLNAMTTAALASAPHDAAAALVALVHRAVSETGPGRRSDTMPR